MRFDGLIIGIGTFLIIGLLHPVVIKAEYYWSTKSWPWFLISGLLCASAALFVSNTIASSLLSVLGFSLLWSIKELFEQKQRVEKGWFPKNTNRKEN